ncbi:MAG: hypothetical protein AAF611_04950 [Bacteroidota bacterium]
MISKIKLAFAFSCIATSVLLAQNDSGVTTEQTISEDLHVIGSMQVGGDSDTSRNFGADTFIMSENNLRMYFEDTSTGSFPGNDWRFTFNDSGNGGSDYFSISDVTANRTPFRIDAGARSNALYIKSDGFVGFGTNDPRLPIHIQNGDTPGFRIHQDGSNGYQTQIWDFAGNESNFFIRDVTNSSQLPFKIRPNTPTNTMALGNAGNVGIDMTAAAFPNINSNASLVLGASDKGFLISRMTTAERTTFEGNLGTGEEGMMVYDSDTDNVEVWTGTEWKTSPSNQNLSLSNYILNIDGGNSADLEPLFTDILTRLDNLESSSSGTSNDATPNFFNYQTALSDTNGNTLANTNVSLRFSIRENTTDGTVVYQETHALTTTAQGIAALTIGNGNVISGVFADINWGASAHFLQIEVDITGGSTYANLGTTQFVSVPYALHAATADRLSGSSATSSRQASGQDPRDARIEALEEELRRMREQQAEILRRLNN